MSGIKHDQNKPDYTYISKELMDEVALVRAFGAKKYAKHNWKKGFKVTRSLAAALRHIFAFLAGETNDPESGLSHLAHAVCGLEHAIYDMKHHPHNDDRVEPPTATITQAIPEGQTVVTAKYRAPTQDMWVGDTQTRPGLSEEEIRRRNNFIAP